MYVYTFLFVDSDKGGIKKENDKRSLLEEAKAMNKVYHLLNT